MFSKSYQNQPPSGFGGGALGHGSTKMIRNDLGYFDHFTRHHKLTKINIKIDIKMSILSYFQSLCFNICHIFLHFGSDFGHFGINF